jgi:hypothetical protein
MRFVALLFLLVAFGFVKGLILSAESGAELDFPEFATPTISGDCSTVNASASSTCIEIFDLSGGCGGFTDCIEYVGNLIWNIGAYFIWLVLFIISLVAFVVNLAVLMGTLLFDPIPGAPSWVSLLINAVLPATLAIKIYRLIREGSDD